MLSLTSLSRCSIVKEETRSVSPHCPKPNESEEPEGTAVEETTMGG